MSTDRNEHRFEPTSLRDPSDLMQPDRLGSLKLTRLSFARLLVDRMAREQWDIRPVDVTLDEDGNGQALYDIETPTHVFSFGVSSRKSGEEENTDRIIAGTWDMEAFLCEGHATQDFMDDQFAELPHVREGRATPETLIWTRANRSSRFFGHIVDALVEGHQPDIEYLATGGYLVRSSGYYGNGLNGTKVFRALSGDHPLKKPYMAQMLAVYMLRVFGYDLAEHMAVARDPDAASLDHDIKQYIGTGNSSGVGIVLHVINHPQLIHTWLRAREIALARAKSFEPTSDELETFADLLRNAEEWFLEDESHTNRFFTSKDTIAREIEQALERVDARADDPGDFRWTHLCEWARDALEMETQEVIHSLLIDVYPEVCQGLESALRTSEKSDVVPEMTVSTLQSIVESDYQWALDIDMSAPGARRHFWYRSIEGEEPRMGVREGNDYEEYALGADIALQVQQLRADLRECDPTGTVAEFLFEHPEHRYVVERIQTVHDLAYAEIRANPLDADFVPLYYISCLKSIWGIQKAHPKSKGWVRGTFFQGAPLPEDLRAGRNVYWIYPSKPEQAERWRDR